MQRLSIAFLLLTLSYLGCTQSSRIPAGVSDASLFRAALTSFYNNPEMDFPLDGKLLYVSLETYEGDSVGLSWGNDFQVDAELVESLIIENQTSILLSQDDVECSFVRIVPISVQKELDLYNPKPEHSDAKCGLRFWKPGYSRDGKHAILRFAFGPTPHGAVATYILTKDGEKWNAIRANVSYYS